MTEAGRLLGGEGLDRVVERMRRIKGEPHAAPGPDSVHGGMLEALAFDITGAFPEQASRREITAFIRAWKP